MPICGPWTKGQTLCPPWVDWLDKGVGCYLKQATQAGYLASDKLTTAARKLLRCVREEMSWPCRKGQKGEEGAFELVTQKTYSFETGRK